MVVAAAGWGKTTALATWAASRQAAWLGLDTATLDAGHLAGRLLDALAIAAGDPATPATDDGHHTALALCERLDGHLDRHTVLVLDDVQELQPGSPAARLLETLCRSAPERLHLVLAARRDPPFSLERLRGQGRVGDVDAARLAFDDTEIAALLRATLGQDPPGLAALAATVGELTGGWPAAVRLTVEALRDVGPEERPAVLERLCRPGGRLWTYMTEEVLAHEPERSRALLGHLAVLDRMDGALGQAVGLPDTARLLADLTRRGLARFTPAPEPSWSAVRPLREVLTPVAPVGSSEQMRLHGRAAAAFARWGAHGRALRHLVAAGDGAGVAAALAEHGPRLVDAGEVDTVLAAARLLPPHLDDPEVQQVLGDAWRVRGQWAGALACFERAARGAKDLPPALAWRTGLVLHARGEARAALAVYGRARTGREDTVDEAVLLAWTAHAHRMTGDYDRGRELAARALAAAGRCDHPSARCAAHSVLATLAAAQGHRCDADAHYSSALNTVPGSALLQHLWVRTDHALHLLEQGLPAAALTGAEEALRLGDRCGFQVLRGIAATVRGRANVMLGRLGPAADDLTAARDLFQRLGSRFAAWPLCGLGHLHRLRGELALARAAFEEALALAEPANEVLGLGAALTGLARVRATDDLDTAHKLAERAVTLGEGLRQVQALITRGWVALKAGDRASAAGDAERAAGLARVRRDLPGLAEALTLGVLAAPCPPERAAVLEEAVRLWRQVGCPLEEAQVRLAAARLAGPAGRPDADAAWQLLQAHELDTGASGAAGLLAALPGMPPPIRIRSLGAFQVLRGAQPIPAAAWRSKKARDLVRILVARRGRPVPREQLLELLWPDELPDRAGSRLSVLLSTVRGVLHPQRQHADAGPLMADRSVVWLDRDQLDIDVEQFLAAANAALDAHRSGQEGTTGRLAAAEALYGGEFLEDDPYQEWAEPLREDARTTYVAVLRALARACRQAGDTDRAVRYTLRLLELDGYDEEAHLTLVRTLLDADRRGEAYRRYQVYAQRMLDLGVTPTPYPGPTGARPRRSSGQPCPPTGGPGPGPRTAQVVRPDMRMTGEPRGRGR